MFRKILFLVIAGGWLSLLKVPAQDTTIPSFTWTQPVIVEDLQHPAGQRNYQLNQLLVPSQQDWDMAQNLTGLPSVWMFNDNGNSLGYSYFKYRNLDPNRLNITLNGVPLTDPIDQNMYFANWPGLAGWVNNVALSAGAGLSTGGTSGYLGQLNFSTPLLTDSSYRRFNLGVGSWQTYSGRLGWADQKNNWHYLSQANYQTSNGYRDNAFYQGVGWMGQLTRVYDKGWVRILSSLNRARNGLAWLPSPESIITDNPRYNPLTRVEQDDFSQTLNQIQWQHQILDHDYVELNLYHVGIYGDYPVAVSSQDLYNYNINSNVYGGYVSLRHEVGPNRYSVGTSLIQAVRKYEGAFLPWVDNWQFNNNWQKIDIQPWLSYQYTNFDYQLKAQLAYRLLNLSYRAQVKTNQIDQAHVNYKLPQTKISLTRTLNPGQTYISLAWAEREPARSDLLQGYDFIDSLNLTHILPLENSVLPEQVLDLELGYKGRIGPVAVNLNVFGLRFWQEIAAVGSLTPAGLPRRINVPNSYRVGLESEFSYKLPLNLILIWQNTYQRSQIMEYRYQGQTIAAAEPLLSPHWLGNISLQGDWPTKHGRWQARTQFQYQSESYLTNDENPAATLPTNITLSANMGYTWSRYSAQIMAYNLLNQNNFNSGMWDGQERSFWVSAPLSIYANLRINF